MSSKSKRNAIFKNLLFPSSEFSWVFWIIGCGISVRIALALMRLDSVWPDEHYQSLEPASRLIYGRGYLAWEWTQAYRAMTLPLIYSPVLLICKWFGVTGGVIPIVMCRLLMVALSGVSLWSFYQILVYSKIKTWIRLLVLSLFSLSTPMLLWGPSTLGDYWVMLVMLMTLPSLVQYMHNKGSQSQKSSSSVRTNLKDLGYGFLAGLPLLFKVQGSVLALGICLCLALIRPSFVNLIFFGMGVILNVGILGVMDKLTYGKFFSSLYQQIRYGEKIALTYGVSPWYDYFPRVVEDQGIWLPLCLCVFGAMVVFSVARTGPYQIKLRFKKLVSSLDLKSIALRATLIPGILYFLFHMKISHKETRFLLPTYPAMYCLLAILIDDSGIFKKIGQNKMLRNINGKYKNEISHFLHLKRLAWIGVVTLILISGVQYARAFRTPLYLSVVDISPLEARVYKEHQANKNEKECVLMLEHNWAWTRGDLILGDNMDTHHRSLSEINSENYNKCKYVILPTKSHDQFIQKSKTGWKWLETAPRSKFELLVRE